MSEIAKTDFSAGDKLLASQLNTMGELVNRAGFMNLTLGETLAINKPVFMASAEERIQAVAYNKRGKSYHTTTTWSPYRYSQSFTTPSWMNKLNYVVLFETSNNDTTTKYASLYAVDGSNNPTGSALATITAQRINSINFNFSLVFDFDGVDVNPNTKYAIVIYHTSGDGIPFNYADYTDAYNLDALKVSSDGGTSWGGVGSYTACVTIYGSYSGTSGKIYQAKGNNISQGDFIGFNIGGGSADDVVAVQTNGIISGLSGLTIGADYYLSDTGTLSTTRGSLNIKIGKALSATSILIEKEYSWLGGINFGVNNASSYGVLSDYSFVVPTNANKIHIDITGDTTNGYLFNMDFLRNQITTSFDKYYHVSYGNNSGQYGQQLMIRLVDNILSLRVAPIYSSVLSITIGRIDFYK